MDIEFIDIYASGHFILYFNIAILHRSVLYDVIELHSILLCYNFYLPINVLLYVEDIMHDARHRL